MKIANDIKKIEIFKSIKYSNLKTTDTDLFANLTRLLPNFIFLLGYFNNILIFFKWKPYC
jgi:hypothetical protein